MFICLFKTVGIMNNWAMLNKVNIVNWPTAETRRVPGRTTDDDEGRRRRRTDDGRRRRTDDGLNDGRTTTDDDDDGRPRAVSALQLFSPQKLVVFSFFPESSRWDLSSQMVSKPLEALFERVLKVLLQTNCRFYDISKKKGDNLHAALDWEVMFLTEFSTWKLKIPER